MRILWDKYYSDSHALIYVIDSTNYSRINENYKEIEKLLLDRQLLDAPLLILVNKQDKGKEAKSVEEISRMMNFEGISDSKGGLNVTNYSASHAVSSSSGASIQLAAFEVHGQKMTQGREIRFQSVSALNGQGIEEAMEWIIKVIQKSKRTEDLAENHEIM